MPSETKAAKPAKAAPTLAAKRARQIKRQNAWFASLGKAEKRVAIARDVLAQLKSGRLVAEEGNWLSGAGDMPLLEDEWIGSDMQVVLLAKEQCTGCALGGLFLCAVERANKLALTKELQCLGGEDLVHYLGQFFSRQQLVDIECAFEGSSALEPGSPAPRNRTKDFREGLWGLSVATRMRLIMENIVANGGRFKPRKLPVFDAKKQDYTTPGFTK